MVLLKYVPVLEWQVKCRLSKDWLSTLHEGGGGVNSWNSAATAWRGSEKAQ